MQSKIGRTLFIAPDCWAPLRVKPSLLCEFLLQRLASPFYGENDTVEGMRERAQMRMREDLFAERFDTYMALMTV